MILVSSNDLESEGRTQAWERENKTVILRIYKRTVSGAETFQPIQREKLKSKFMEQN